MTREDALLERIDATWSELSEPSVLKFLASARPR